MKLLVRFLIVATLMPVFFVNSCGKVKLPSVQTLAVSDVTQNSAVVDASVIGVPGSPVLARGICWGVNSKPTLADSFITESLGDGIFTVQINGLQPNKKYYVRAFGTSSEGTGYGQALEFTTLALPPFPAHDIDGNGYDTVHIGTQVWMKQNLRVTHYNDGAAIPVVATFSTTTWPLLSTGAMGWYFDENDNLETYGALYNWYAVNTGKLCPTGWHVPTTTEWDAMVNLYGGASVAGGALKETAALHWNSPNTGATNSSGFTALPGGYRNYSQGMDVLIGQEGYFWTSTDYNGASAMARAVYYNNSQVGSGHNSSNYGFSVRCIKN